MTKMNPLCLIAFELMTALLLLKSSLGRGGRCRQLETDFGRCDREWNILASMLNWELGKIFKVEQNSVEWDVILAGFRESGGCDGTWLCSCVVNILSR